MRSYKAYILGDDGHVIARVDLPDCDDDEAAKHKARKVAIGQAVELWDGPRKIATFQPTNPDP
ncbi:MULTISPECIES: hypothetical protein [Bradyrhizobium]|uniref:hypothetical protein n=1 Tax=Bradyrhizobium TaxID=374 RepID=UPI0004B0C546|nr:hypothetical protein [Bradyrhizobium elkanii]WLA81302.1 hypothetical protein QNJ99_39010 [Bradyrhizobium elkanii]